MGRLSAQRILIPGLGQTGGEECTSTSSTFAESATPKGASCDPRTNGDTCIWVNSRRYYRVKFGSARKGLRPLRQLYCLKRFCPYLLSEAQ